MKAFLIDPHTMTVSECEYNNQFAGPGGAYELLGVEIIEAVYCIDERHNIFVDEEGRFKSQPGFFTSLWPYGPLSGRGMVVGGPDDDGNGTPCTLSLEGVTNSIQWISNVPEL